VCREDWRPASGQDLSDYACTGRNVKSCVVLCSCDEASSGSSPQEARADKRHRPSPGAEEEELKGGGCCEEVDHDAKFGESDDVFDESDDALGFADAQFDTQSRAPSLIFDMPGTPAATPAATPAVDTRGSGGKFHRLPGADKKAADGKAAADRKAAHLAKCWCAQYFAIHGFTCKCALYPKHLPSGVVRGSEVTYDNRIDGISGGIGIALYALGAGDTYGKTTKTNGKAVDTDGILVVPRINLQGQRRYGWAKMCREVVEFVPLSALQKGPVLAIDARGGTLTDNYAPAADALGREQMPRGLPRACYTAYQFGEWGCCCFLCGCALCFTSSDSSIRTGQVRCACISFDHNVS